MGLSVLPGRGDNRETGARPVQSRCRKEQLFSTRNAATGKPGRRRQGVNSEPEYLPTFMFRAALRTTEMRKKAGRQFIDVGIAEENAVALASGIAANGGKPVYGVYSTFIQRAYDQISQDLCINSNAATIIVAWGSIYGMNDVTHLGLYDIPMLANIPNLVYLAPTTKEEYLAMLDWSIEQNEHPVVIRMPGGALVSGGKAVTKDFGRLNTYEVKEKGAKVAVIGLGSFYTLGEQAAALIKEKTGVQPTLINPYYITGVDTDLLESLKADHDVVITLEDGVLTAASERRSRGSTAILT